MFEVFLKQLDGVALQSVDMVAVSLQLFGCEQERSCLRHHGDQPVVCQSFEKQILRQPDRVSGTRAEKVPDEKRRDSEFRVM